jgi:hypothetical protein
MLWNIGDLHFGCAPDQRLVSVPNPAQALHQRSVTGSIGLIQWNTSDSNFEHLLRGHVGVVKVARAIFISDNVWEKSCPGCLWAALRTWQCQLRMIFTSESTQDKKAPHHIDDD